MSDPQIPNDAAVIGPGIDKLVAARPSAAPHVESGRYGDVIVGWKGQFELERKRLVEEVTASRLKLAEAQALRELAKSEYDTPTNGSSRATGIVQFLRSVVHYVAGTPIDASTPTDEASALSALAAIKTAMQVHAASVFDSGIGLGAHALADATSDWNYPAISTYSDEVGAANWLRLAASVHFGAGGAWHPSYDSVNPNPVTPSTASAEYVVPLAQGGTDTWANASPASRMALLRLIGALISACNAHIALEARAGTIRRGTRVSVVADPTATPPAPGGEYQVTQDTPILTGQALVGPPIEALQDGPESNLPLWIPVTSQTITTAPLFDASATLRLLPGRVYAAGGSNGQSDGSLKRAAAAAFTGRYGPTHGAVVAGSLRFPGMGRAVVFEDKALGRSIVHACDESWAYSPTFMNRLTQELKDNWIGFGCRVITRFVENKLTRVELVVQLRDARFLSDTTAITDKIQARLRAYFDERPDWYTWRLASIRGVVTRADKKRILTCASAVVRDGSGVPIAEPVAVLASDSVLMHYALTDNAVSVTYEAPQ